MSLAKIIWAVSALAALVLAFVSTGHNGMILAILGLASGFFLDHDHRRGVIIAAIFLMLGGANALNGIIGIGDHLGAILGSLGAVFSAAAVMAILKTLIERLFLSNKASATS
jgi:hypothetical protein